MSLFQADNRFDRMPIYSAVQIHSANEELHKHLSYKISLPVYYLHEWYLYHIDEQTNPNVKQKTELNSNGSLLRKFLSKTLRVTSQILPNCAAFIRSDAPIASFASHVLLKIKMIMLCFSQELFTWTMSLPLSNEFRVIYLLSDKLHAEWAFYNSDKIKTNDMQEHTYVMKWFTV